MHKKRIKSKNYTEQEKEELLVILTKYKTIIENKGTDEITVQKKLWAWDQISKEFNVISKTGPRTGGQLKMLYKNLKRKTRLAILNEDEQKYVPPMCEIIMDVSEETTSDNTDNLVMMHCDTFGKMHKRIKSKNYTEQEKEEIISIISKYPIVHNKNTDGVTNHRKAQAWEQIAEEFNLISTTGPRNGGQLKMFYKCYNRNPAAKVDKQNITVVSEEKSEEKPEEKRRKTKQNWMALRNIYYKKKIELANFELKAKKILFNLDLKIKREELKYIKIENEYR